MHTPFAATKLETPDLIISLIVPEIQLADPSFNTASIIQALRRLPSSPDKAQVVLLPELALTGVSCADLFFQPLLLEGALHALQQLSDTAQELGLWVTAGLPLRLGGNVYDAAALLGPSGLQGVSLRAQPMDFSAPYPSRQFSAAGELSGWWEVLPGRSVPVSANLALHPAALGTQLQIIVGAAGSVQLARGAGLILNPCAIPARAGLEETLAEHVRAFNLNPAQTLAFCSGGPSDSTAEQVFSGLAGIWQGSSMLTCLPALKLETQSATQILHGAKPLPQMPEQSFAATEALPPQPDPFLPGQNQAAYYDQAFEIQALGLAGRLRHTATQRVVLGLSGGSDSSLALLVCCRAFDILGLPRTNILAVAMPGPGSSAASIQRARAFSALSGATERTISINRALAAHLEDIGHPSGVFDTTFENAQARERTQILMDLANQHEGLVVGTGDLSEEALGWCTYNGDQMSMYNVNAGLPKTLLLRVLSQAATKLFGEAGRQAAESVVNAPISPELLPLMENGQSAQTSEGSLGPYRLHDFFIFHALGGGCPPAEVFRRARSAFAGEYSPATILRYLTVFYRRFFAGQFKRTASPDGPQVLAVSLSPRSGWQMPSDASPALWLAGLARLQSELESEGK